MPNMNYFIGVVEDRKDPKNMGRVRVRIYGDHDADKTKIPTASLPWSQVMMPVTSAACGGVGESATGIVQGSWVVGFYMDGTSKQNPMVMGTIVGSAGADALPDQGFSDPAGRHPMRSEGPDTSYSAIGGVYETTAPYIQKVDLRQERIETAAPEKVTAVVQDEADSYYARKTWDMPFIASGVFPSYPFNKVNETESGHLFEIDDTPGNERFSRFHNSGTNEEFQQNGNKTLTVVGSNYTVVYGSDNIYIKGTANITVDGDLRQLVKKNEIKCFLSDEADSLDCYIEIHAGAGGTESQDWADMLRRMYLKWSYNKKFKSNLISEHKGDEAGIKSSTIKIEGDYVFGWLKRESGIHRLVRISPFDSGARRHTSFASIWVYPVVDENINIEINEKDLRIDTYRSSGAGGQHVNTTDSAVRITHVPSKIVVQCQNERSQHKNKETCMNMLKARLYDYEIKKREKENQSKESSKSDIGWGHQIRSYILQPYRLVKDNRTNFESTSPDKVLDGEIDNFLEKSLHQIK